MTASGETSAFRVAPGGRLSGRVRVPGDKSISHRIVMLGAIAEGVTEADGFLEGADALATVAAMRAMGVAIERPAAGRLVIQGAGLHGLKPASAALDLGNAGTALRLLCGLLAGQGFASTLTGDDSLRRRPMHRIIEPLTDMGADIEYAQGGKAPLRIKGGGALHGIDYQLPVASAQVKSCLLLAGLYAAGVTRIHEPMRTRDHTERMLHGFGCPLRRDADAVVVTGGQRLRGTRVEIPADISSAAFLLVGASIAPGSDVILEHVGINPTRAGVIAILERMGARIEVLTRGEAGGEPVADLRVRHASLRGIDVPTELVAAAIDEFPALFVAAACAEGETVVTGAEELRYKESDRIATMAEGLHRLNIDAQALPDGLRIRGGRPGGGRVAAAGDHRVAMAFAMAGLAASGEIIIDDCANVETSFPGFAALAAEAGLGIHAVGEALLP